MGTAFFRHGRKRPYRTHRVTGHQICIYCTFGPYILYFWSVYIVLVFGILYILLLVRIYFDTGPIIFWYWSIYIVILYTGPYMIYLWSTHVYCTCGLIYCNTGPTIMCYHSVYTILLVHVCSIVQVLVLLFRVYCTIGLCIQY